jgi:hypothetical protein
VGVDGTAPRGGRGRGAFRAGAVAREERATHVEEVREQTEIGYEYRVPKSDLEFLLEPSPALAAVPRVGASGRGELP